MQRFHKYISIRRDYFFSFMLFQDKDEKSFQQHIKIFSLLNKRFHEAIDLLPKREQVLFMQHINNPNNENPLYFPTFISEKNQNYARLLVNRAVAVVEDYLRRFGLDASIPHVPMKADNNDDEEDGELDYGEGFYPEDPLSPYRERAKSLNISPQILYDFDHLKKKEPEVSSLSERELYLRIKDKCAENDLPSELTFYLMTAVAEYLKKDTCSPILLVGNPGIGKTYFAKVFAEIIGLYYYQISAPGAAAGRGLSGDSPSFRAASYGAIADAQLQAKSTNPVILVDEVDKCFRVPTHHPLNDELLSCLDGSRNIKDHFFEVQISTSQIPFILTANVLSNIPPWLRDRCITVVFPDPDSKRIVSIVTKQFDKIKNNALYQNRLKIDRQALLNRVETMRSKGIVSLRQYNSFLENAAKAAYLELIENNKKSITISAYHFDQVEELLGNRTKTQRFGFSIE